MTEGKVYFKNKIEGMNNDERILFIYNKLLENLHQAKSSIISGDIQEKVIKINKSIEIISSLLSILDMKAGGEIAVRLRSLYIYSIDQLTKANIENKVEGIDEINKLYSQIHQSWHQKIQKDKNPDNQESKSKINTLQSNPQKNAAYPRMNNSGIEVYG